jgi:hypothetical protein
MGFNDTQVLSSLSFTCDPEYSDGAGPKIIASPSLESPVQRVDTSYVSISRWMIESYDAQKQTGQSPREARPQFASSLAIQVSMSERRNRQGFLTRIPGIFPFRAIRYQGFTSEIATRSVDCRPPIQSRHSSPGKICC